MPLVRVAVRQGNTEAYRAAIEEGIHRAMVETIDVPPDDRFQIWSQHSPTELIFDGSYLGIERGEGFLVIQIFLNSGRSLEKKRALYRKIADNLARDPGIRPGPRCPGRVIGQRPRACRGQAEREGRRPQRSESTVTDPVEHLVEVGDRGDGRPERLTLRRVVHPPLRQQFSSWYRPPEFICAFVAANPVLEDRASARARQVRHDAKAGQHGMAWPRSGHLGQKADSMPAALAAVVGANDARELAMLDQAGDADVTVDTCAA